MRCALSTEYAYIQAWISWLTAIATDYRIFSCLFKHALLQMLRQIIFNNQNAFDDTLCTGMGT